MAGNPEPVAAVAVIVGMEPGRDMVGIGQPKSAAGLGPVAAEMGVVKRALGSGGMEVDMLALLPLPADVGDE